MIYAMRPKLMADLGTLAKGLLDLVYPPRCLACGGSGEEDGLCARCAAGIKPNPMPWCPKCGRGVESAKTMCPECENAGFSFERNYSACLYEGVIKECVHQFKYRGRVRLSRRLSFLMINFVREHREIIEGIDSLTAVPLSGKKFREREYNQSEILARHVAKEFSIPYLDALIKKASTRPQSELTRDDRKVNVKGAFTVKETAAVEGKRILIIDDVFTTGSTINEVSKALAAKGAEKIYSLTLARGA